MLLPNSTMGKIWTLSTLILSLSRFDRSVQASDANVFDFCSEKHCEDCANGELLKCSNDATTSDRGDLCRCCKSCVKFRDYGESCGSQLAVRSFENFDDSRSRVTILATTMCKENFICKNFTCERLENVKNNENISFDPSSHLINLLVRGREFQLIYGHEALADLKMLIESIDKNQQKSLINEIEGKIIYERFKDFCHHENHRNAIETKKSMDTLRDSEVMMILQNSLLLTYASKILRLKSSGKNLREKRELDEESKNDKKIDEITSKERSRVYVYDIVNKTPGSVEDFGEWSIGQKDQINLEKNTRMGEPVVDDGIDSEINIRIDGVPRMMNFQDNNDKNLSRKKDEIIEKYGNYDDLEIFVDNDRPYVPVVSTMKQNFENPSNFNSSAKFPSQENPENYTNVWKNEEDEFTDRFINYQLNFPENPASLNNLDTPSELDTFGKKNVDEFSDQLERIETKVIDIENSLLDMMEKIDERFDDIEDKKMDIERVEIEPGGRNESVEKLSTPRHKIIVRLSNENSSSRTLRPSTKSVESFFGRNSRMITNPPNLSKVERISLTPRRGKIDDQEATSSRKIMKRGKSDRGLQESPARGSRNFLKARTNLIGRKNVPIFLSNKDSSRVNYYNDRNHEPRLFSLERSNLEVTSGSLYRHRPLWPLNLILNRVIGTDRSKRKSERSIGRRGRHLKSENPETEESAIFLETQIPKSIVDDRIEDSSTRLLTRYGDDDVSNWRDENPSINLFIVDEDNPEFDRTFSSSELQETHMESMEQDHSSNEQVDDNYPILPAYLDYSDDSEKMEHLETVSTSETTEKPLNLDTNEKLYSKSRKKRDVLSDSNDLFSSTKKIENLDKKQSEINNLSIKRWKRGVEMVGWLRAAQEYHECLHQVRNAAMKTWLASREALDDANFTDVKLFTQEIPAYLERYRPENLEENYSGLGIEDIIDEEKPDETSMNGSDKTSEISSLVGPRKYTIITSGNSTMKIDRLFDNGDVEFVDEQTAEGTSRTEVTDGIPMVVNENDYFDHMYESVEADDHEFDYDDSTATMSAWGDRVDVIESSSVQVPRSDEISKVNEDEIDESEKDVEEDSSTRFKRDSPVLLFKLKGNPTSKEVLVWPSNWRDLIDRHSRINRKGGSTRTPANRRSYSRIARIHPKIIANASFDNDVR